MHQSSLHATCPWGVHVREQGQETFLESCHDWLQGGETGRIVSALIAVSKVEEWKVVLSSGLAAVMRQWRPTLSITLTLIHKVSVSLIIVQLIAAFYCLYAEQVWFGFTFYSFHFRLFCTSSELIIYLFLESWSLELEGLAVIPTTVTSRMVRRNSHHLLVLPFSQIQKWV